MSPFEFSFTFYGLVLGLSVVELVAGVGRLVHEGHRIRFGWLTPALAVFLALDVATFWNQAWVMNQHAPYSLSLLILGLTSAGLFYIAATLVFPRDIRDGEDLTVHYWRHRRLVFSLVAAANFLNIGAFTMLSQASEPSLLWENLAFLAGFAAVTLAAAFLPRGRLAIACLLLLLSYNLAVVVFDAVSLMQNGAWPLGDARPGAGTAQ